MSARLRVVEVGSGYACRFAGWVLAGQGMHVRRLSDKVSEDAGSWGWVPGDAPERLDPQDLPAALVDADVLLVDDRSPLDVTLFPGAPRPPGLEHLVVVELLAPAPQADANAAIGAGTGINAAIGEPDGPGRPPPGRMLEAIVGLHAATAVIAGQLGSERDRLGEHVVIDPAVCLAGMVGVNAIQFFNYGLRWFRSGSTAFGSGGPFPFRLLRAKDGWVVAMCRSRDEWEALLALLGHPTWSARAEFQDPLQIARHHSEEVTELIEHELAHRTVGELWDAARAHRVPMTPLRTADDVIADERLFAAAADGPQPRPAIEVREAANAEPSRWPARRQPMRGPATSPPLAGLRVLDLGWVWAAPIAGAWLADLGADVVKVESLGNLDIARRRGIEFPSGEGGNAASLPGYEQALVFSACNRNKRSLQLNLKDPGDHHRFLGLVETADVVLENFTASTLERLQLPPERLFEVNPSLLLVSMGGRTADGEFVTRSYAPMLSALAGLDAAVTGSDGAPVGMLNWGVADPNAGSWAVLAVLGALARGEGGVHLLVSQLRGLVNTCLALYREPQRPPEPERHAEELTAAHLEGSVTTPLGRLMREVTVRSWQPLTGERVGFRPPWRFRRMPVDVRCGAPLIGDVEAEDVAAAWTNHTT